MADSLVALHATDPATVFLSVRARAPGADVAAVEDALYGRRSLLRMLGMRRTMFVVPDAVAPVIQAAATDAIAVVQRKRYVKLMTDGGAGDGAFLRRVEEATRGRAGRPGRGDRRRSCPPTCRCCGPRWPG